LIEPVAGSRQPAVAIADNSAISESGHAEWCEEGANRGGINLFRLALDGSLWADGAWARCCGRADSRRRTLDLRAARTRARRALAALGLHILAGINDNRLLLGDGALQHILR
jgi:hypothetical protein